MKDKPMTLGEKIKAARLARKMTQSEVVGNYITRNMLSQIENDVATPSIKTLEYLSKVLDVPLSYFMSSLVDISEDDSKNFDNRETIHLNKAKQLFKDGKYEKCIEELNKISGDGNDEVFILKALAHLEEASCHMIKSNYKEAVFHAEKSIACNRESLYYNPDLHLKALLILMESSDGDDRLFNNYLNEYKSIIKGRNINSEFYLIYGVHCHKSGDVETMQKLIKSMKNHDDMLSGDEEFGTSFLSGLIEINKNNFSAATELLKKSLSKCDNLRFRIMLLKMLEQCSIKLEDYKSAYEYANERLKYIGLK